MSPSGAQVPMTRRPPSRAPSHPPAHGERRLPTRPTPAAGEALDGYLERLAAANHLTHPALARLLGSHENTAWLPLQPRPTEPPLVALSAQPDDVLQTMAADSLPGSRTRELVSGVDASASWRRSAAAGWAFGRGTQACPACLAEDGTWKLIWRHPWVVACLPHRTWLHAVCPACSLPFRSYRHHVLRSVDAPAGTCGNATGHRGRPCPQVPELLPLIHIDGPARAAVSGHDNSGAQVLASQTRIQGAAAGNPQLVAGERVSGEEYLAETKALTVLLLHLAVQPGGHALAPWAAAAHADRDRSPGPRTARWGLAPPADPQLRGHALAAADRILTAEDFETAAERLHPWTELTPATGDGQLGWLADHTHMTPTLTRLVMSATANRRRISTLLDHDPPAPTPPTAAIPQVIPAGLYRRHLAQHLDVGGDVGRSYAALCLTRRALAGCGTSTCWRDAAHALRIPQDVAEPIWRRGSSRVTCQPDQFVRALDAFAAALDPKINYRAREDAVRRLATRHRWYRTWARTHHPGSRATSRDYAVTWLWTRWARGLSATSPAWATPPDRVTRGYQRRYAARLTPAAQTALIGIAESRLDASAR